MLFSIIIPVYNVEKYLRECVGNLLEQDFHDFEVILVDDGATDSSGAICDEYAENSEKVKVIHQKNAGQAVARNAGTEIAQGEYVIYIDSDDYICDKAFLSKLAVKTEKQPDVILYGYKKFFESNKTFGKDVCAYPELEGKDNEQVIQLLLESDMYTGCPWNKAIKRSFIEKYSIRYLPKMISEDTDWFLQVVLRAESYTAINEAFLVYRQREGSTSHALKIKSLTDNLYILETWSKRFEEEALSDGLKGLLTSVLARYYANLLVLYTRFPGKEAKPYYPRVKALKYLLKYSQTQRARIVRLVSSIAGLKLALVALKLLGKIKRTI